jgi:membrane protein DedA with SNARE-associated domain
MAIMLVCLLVGVALGQRFKVLVLVPGSGLAFIAVVLVGIARAEAAWTMVLMSIGVVVSLQIGYLAGAAIRRLLVAARASRLRTSLLGASMQARHPAH